MKKIAIILSAFFVLTAFTTTVSTWQNDFFDAEKLPTITFKSTSLEKTEKDKFKLTGNLTMHGITKVVTMDLQYNGTVENAMNKKQTAGFQLTGTIKRSDFGIGVNFPEPMISDEVRIKADGEFIQ